MANRIIFVTITAVDDATKHIGIQVDFGRSIWKVNNNPHGLVLLGDQGKVSSDIIDGSAITVIYLNDGRTAVLTLNLFGEESTEVGGRGLGTLAATDPDDPTDVAWQVDDVA
jgi:hypothetical protein